MQNLSTKNDASNRNQLVWLCVTVFLVALLMRAGFGIMQMSKMQDAGTLQYPDEQWYWHIATQVSEGNGLVGEFGHKAGRMPLYPGFLSLFAGSDNAVVLVRITQWVIGALAAVFTTLLAVRIKNSGTGLIAGFLIACDPGLVGTANLLLTETLFVSLVAAWWWVSWPLFEKPSTKQPGRWILVGLLAAATVYSRPAGLALIPLWIALQVFSTHFSKASIAGNFAVVLIVLLALLPWAKRNMDVTGKWCWLTTRAGISLYDGIQPKATGAGDLADIKQMEAVHDLSEHEWNDWFKDESHRLIAEDPTRIISLGFTKLARTWSPFLHAEELQSAKIRLIFAAWSILFYTLILLGFIVSRRDYRLWMYLILPALMICGVHFFYVGSIRYRLGALPGLAVLAGIGIATIAEKYRRPDTQGDTPVKES